MTKHRHRVSARRARATTAWATTARATTARATVRVGAVALAASLLGVAAAKVPAKLPEDKVRGRDLYQDLCWQCHGPAAEGDGPSALLLSSPVPGLRDRPESSWPELVEVVLDGRGDMPAYKNQFAAPDARRIMVWLAAVDAGDVKVKPTRKLPQSAQEEPPTDADTDTGGPADADTDAKGPADSVEGAAASAPAQDQTLPQP